jgi:hypothetical protein
VVAVAKDISDSVQQTDAGAALGVAEAVADTATQGAVPERAAHGAAIYEAAAHAYRTGANEAPSAEQSVRLLRTGAAQASNSLPEQPSSEINPTPEVREETPAGRPSEAVLSAVLGEAQAGNAAASAATPAGATNGEAASDSKVAPAESPDASVTEAEKALNDFKEKQLARVERSVKAAEREAENREQDKKELGVIDRLNGTAKVVEKSAREAQEQATHLRSEQERLKQSELQAKELLAQAREAKQQSESLREQGKFTEAAAAEKQAVSYSKDALALLNGQKLDQRFERQRQQAQENAALAGQAAEKTQVAIEVTKTVQQVAIGAVATGATVATGGLAGVVIGATLGTAVGTASAAVEQSGYVAEGLKTKEEALKDFKDQALDSAKLAATSAVAGAAGRAVMPFLGAGTSTAARLAAGSAAGATSGVVSSVTSDGIAVVQAQLGVQNEFSGLSAAEVAQKMATNAAWGAVSGGVGGVVGAGGESGRQVVKSVTAKVATRIGEAAADTVTGVAVEATRAKAEGREFSAAEARQAITQAIGGSIASAGQDGVTQKLPQTEASSSPTRAQEDGKIIQFPGTERPAASPDATAPADAKAQTPETQPSSDVRLGNNGAVYHSSQEAVADRYIEIRSKELIQDSFRRGEPITREEAHAEARSEARTVSAFYDPETQQFHAVDPARIQATTRKERVEIGAMLAHEVAHRNGADEFGAWQRWSEHVVKNGFQPVFENGRARVEVVPPGTPVVRASDAEIQAHIGRNYGDEQTRLAAARGVEGDSAVPTPSRFTPDMSKLREWVDAAPDAATRTARQVVLDHTAVIPHHKFMEHLNAATDKLKLALRDIPVEQQIVLVSNSPTTSNRWCYDLVRDKVATPGMAESYFLAGWEKMAQHPTLSALGERRTLIVFDDAAYSGTQIGQRWAQPIQDFVSATGSKPIEIFYVSAFHTERAQQRISELNSASPNVKVRLISGGEIPLAETFLSPDQKILLSPDSREDPIVFSTSTIAFDHKVPDNHSLLLPVLEVFHTEAPVPPYKAKGTAYYEQGQQDFEKYKQAVFRDKVACIKEVPGPARESTNAQDDPAVTGTRDSRDDSHEFGSVRRTASEADTLQAIRKELAASLPRPGDNASQASKDRTQQVAAIKDAITKVCAYVEAGDPDGVQQRLVPAREVLAEIAAHSKQVLGDDIAYDPVIAKGVDFLVRPVIGVEPKLEHYELGHQLLHKPAMDLWVKATHELNDQQRAIEIGDAIAASDKLKALREQDLRNPEVRREIVQEVVDITLRAHGLKPAPVSVDPDLQGAEGAVQMGEYAVRIAQESQSDFADLVDTGVHEARHLFQKALMTQHGYTIVGPGHADKVVTPAPTSETIKQFSRVLQISGEFMHTDLAKAVAPPNSDIAIDTYPWYAERLTEIDSRDFASAVGSRIEDIERRSTAADIDLQEKTELARTQPVPHAVMQEAAQRLESLIPGLSKEQAYFILNKALHKGEQGGATSIVFFGSRIRGDFTPASDLDVGFNGLTENQARKVINATREALQQGAFGPAGLRLENTTIVPGKTDPLGRYKPIESPEEFAMREGIRSASDGAKAGQPFQPSGYIKVDRDGTLTVVRP